MHAFIHFFLSWILCGGGAEKSNSAHEYGSNLGLICGGLSAALVLKGGKGGEMPSASL